MRTAWSTLRLLIALVSCAAASMIFIPAPTTLLFKVVLAVTEYGHWFFLLPLLIAFLPARRTALNLGSTALALVATALLLSTAVRAGVVARQLPANLARAFPMTGAAEEHPPIDPPFSWKNLWFARHAPAIHADDYAYATHEKQDLHLLFYRCGDSRPAPCVIMIHGGGWETGSLGQFPQLNEHLAARGYAVADVEYRLAPRWPWPAQREDVLEAMDYLAHRATEMHIDPQRFIVVGRSAGGQIAEAVAYGARRPAIRGCIAFYSPADMNYAYEFGRHDDIVDSLRLVVQYMGGTPAEVRGNYDSASGILLAVHDSPPTLLVHGIRDELVWIRQSQRLNARLEAVGAPHFLLQLPWATHAFDFNFHGPGGQLSTYAVDTFLDAVTR